MLPQLGCGANRRVPSSVVRSADDQLRHELGEHLDHGLAIAALHEGKRAAVERRPRRRGQRRERRGGERVTVAGELVEGEDQVGAAGEEVVVDGEGGDRAADEEGVSGADDAVGEPEHEFASGLLLVEELGGAAPEDELDGALGGGGEARGALDGVPHVDYLRLTRSLNERRKYSTEELT